MLKMATWFLKRFIPIIMVMLMLAEPTVAQLDGRAELRLQEMADTRAAQAEIVGRMRAVLTLMADTFSRTRDQAMVEHHRTSTTIHSSFGTLVQAAIDTGLKVHLCEAGKPDHVGDDWLFVWYDPPADLRAIASPEEVRHASNPITQTNPFANAGSIQPFWIDVPPEPEFTMMFGRPVPAGFMDCYAQLDTPTVGMAVKPRIPVAERRQLIDWEVETRACPAGEVGTGIHFRKHTITIETGFDEAPPAGYYSAPTNYPGAVETPPGSGIFDTGWVEQHRSCRPPESGTRYMAEACTYADDSGTTRQGLRLVEVGWTERQDTNDPTRIEVYETGILREIIPCGDWGTDDWNNDFEVPIYERADTAWQRSIACQTVHGASYKLGTRTEGRVKTTVTTKWPARMNRADDVNVSHTPWSQDPASCMKVRGRNGQLVSVHNTPPCHDACHGEFTYSEHERKQENCGAGYSGVTVWLRSRTYVMKEYPAPVPHKPDVRVRESAWGPWAKTSDTCQRITTPGNSNDDDDDDNSLSPPPRRNTNNDDDGGGGGNYHPGGVHDDSSESQKQEKNYNDGTRESDKDPTTVY